MEDDTIDFSAPVFEWTTVSRQSTPVSYRLQVASDLAFTMLEIDTAGLSGATYASLPLDAGSEFYFRVEASDAALNGSGFTSPNHFFTALDHICGDSDGNETVSIGDAVFIINYIFGGGPAPNSLEAADSDCSGAVSIGDAVYIINFIFGGGPAPCSACP
jgi:hypothetical protein